MTDIYKFQLDNLTGEEMTELRRLRDVRFLRTEQKQIHLSHQTDSFGNEVSPTKYEYNVLVEVCLLYTSPSPRDVEESRMPSSA